MACPMSPRRDSGYFAAHRAALLADSEPFYDNHGDADLVLTSAFHHQEHVLRDVSNGSDPTSRQTRARSSSIITNPYENDYVVEDNNSRGNGRNRSGRYSKYSPTPSIKRGKAEKLLKEHGSPPGIRVTAGGRIVPDGVSPIASPRFYQNVPYKHQNYNRIARPYGASTNASLNVANGMIFDLGNGVFAQLVDGEFRPIEQQNGIAQLHIPFAMPISMPAPGYAKLNPNAAYHNFQPPNPNMPTGPWANYTPPTDEVGTDYDNGPTARQIRVMEQVHAKLEQELKDLDRNEVLQRGSLSSVKKVEIVKTRIELVNRIDESRRGIIEAKRVLEKALPTNANLDGASSVGLGIFHTDQPGYAGAFGSGAFYGSDPQQASHAASSQVPLTISHYAAPVEGYAPSFPEIPMGPTKQYHDLPGHLETQRVFANPGPFHEPVTKVGMGETGNLESVGVRGSADTVMPYPSNLDGSAQQPRRSHAIQIKAPKDVASNSKTVLNPASPSYQPNQLSAVNYHTNDGSNFMPSPTLIAQTDALVRNPNTGARNLDGPVSAHQPSDDSATTADFFPNDTKQHSARSFSVSTRDVHVNLPAWMKQDVRSSTVQATPGEAVSGKFAWDENTSNMLYTSPSDQQDLGYRQSRRQSTAANSTVSPQKLEDSCDMDFINQSDFTHISPETKRRQSALLRGSTDTVKPTPQASRLFRTDSGSSLLQRVSEEAELTNNHTTPQRSPDYWEGYRTGIHQDVLGNNTTDDYRRGYRDGMIQSTVLAASAPDPTVLKTTSRVSPSGASTTAKRAAAGTNGTPTLRGEGASRFRMPSVPHNSLATTPTGPRSMRKRSQEQSFDSHQRGSDSMSRLDIVERGSKSSGRQPATQPLSLAMRFKDTPSPLANRSASKAGGDIMGSNTPEKFVQGRTVPYDYQRFQKSKPSVAQNDSPAHAFMSGQNDGSTSDFSRTNPFEDSRPMLTTPLSPRSRMSPVRCAATAAAASFAHLTRSGGKKEQEPSNTSSPEKRPWRAKWKMNFDAGKNDGDDEIDNYKRQFANY